MSDTTVFLKRHEGIELGILAHQPSKNLGKIKDIVLSNHRISIRETSEEVGISYRSCERIVSNVTGMKQVVAKFVPKL